MTEEKPIEISSNKDLTKYIAELQQDVKLDLNNLREKSLSSSSIWAKWLSYLYHEKENAQKIVDMKQKILKKKKQSASSNVQDSVLRMKSEEKLAENDENIKKLNTLARITQDNIDYIERALNILQNFGFSIKNTTEILKLNLNH